jgi:sodium transport system permease protein
MGLMNEASREPGPPSTGDALGRLLRLVRKELSEVLRDRRTIITLVFMPLLLYPLLSIAFQQVAAASLLDSAQLMKKKTALGGKDAVAEFRVGFESREDFAKLDRILMEGENYRRAEEAQRAKEARRAEEGRGAEEPKRERKQLASHPWESSLVENLEEALENNKIDVGLRLKREAAVARRPRPGLPEKTYKSKEVEIEIVGLAESGVSQRAEEALERRIYWFQQLMLEQRLDEDDPDSSIVLAHVDRTLLTRPGGGAVISLPALVPLILILMTITGAVYPAIDTTAGERERGTLEMLVAAPVPRLGLLFAKYVTVVAVAVLTGVVNLIGMVVTLKFSGLESEVIKGGLSIEVLIQVVALLVLFALFFSALLLSITSFARSFKEAQAFLIPLMLVSLAPGIIGILPGIKLEKWYVVTPLVNIVLLGRDLFEGQAEAGTAILVVLVTLVYAAAAIALAARVFGAESVLYSEQSGWGDLFRRPEEEQATASVAAALWCLALMIPIHYVAQGTIAVIGVANLPSGAVLLIIMTLLNVLLFFALPAYAAWLGRIRPGSGFALRRAGLAPLALALLLGVCLWPGVLWALERMYEQYYVGVEQLQGGSSPLEAQWPPLLVFAVVLSAVVEEFFFRGFLFTALARVMPGVATVLLTALLFGLLHVVMGGALGTFRFWPSAFMGLLLGFLRLASGSVWPGMLLHALHNTFLQCAPLMGFQHAADLPEIWLFTSGAVLLFGGTVLGWMLWEQRSKLANGMGNLTNGKDDAVFQRAEEEENVAPPDHVGPQDTYRPDSTHPG